MIKREGEKNIERNRERECVCERWGKTERMYERKSKRVYLRERM